MLLFGLEEIIISLMNLNEQFNDIRKIHLNNSKTI